MSYTPTISSQGVGSNIDVNGIVSKLMKVESVPLTNLQNKVSSYESKISALGTIKGALSSLQSAISGLRFGTTFNATSVLSSNSSLIQVSGSSGAAKGSYSIDVSQLAQSQKLVATGQADTTSAIGTGTSTTLTIDLGTISGGTFDAYDATTNPTGTNTYSGATFASNGNGTATITIDSTNNSLQGIQDAINAAGIGVTATIVNDGSASNPYRLVLSSTNTGADQSIKISVSGDATLSSLLSEDPAGTQNFQQTVTAQNALFTVDGISTTKSSNVVTDVISGVTLDLAGTTTGNPVTVTVSQDTASIKDAIKSFVSSYNDLISQIKTQTDSGINGGTKGALASDSLTRDIELQLNNEFNTAVTSITGSYTTLSSIGIAFQKDGTLAVDDTQLTTALETDSANVEKLFSATDGYGTRIYNAVSELVNANGAIDSRTQNYQNYIQDLNNQETIVQSSLDRTEKKLRSQFTSLDVLIGQLSITSNYLSQQLASLNKPSG